MKAFRSLKIATISCSILTILFFHSTALASECEFTFTWKDAAPCVAGYNECVNEFGHPPAACREAMDLCAYGLCLTMHPFCTEECARDTGGGTPEQ